MARFRLGLPYFPNWEEQKKGAGEREMRGGGGGGGVGGRWKDRGGGRRDCSYPAVRHVDTLWGTGGA